MLNILTVVGTRPEAIKMAPVLLALATAPASVRSLLCVTGQHRELLDQVLPVFGLKPDIDLGLMTPNQTLARLTADLVTGVDRVVHDTQPDWILAQGDTTTVMAAALVAFYHKIKFGHVEAGLRTGDRFNPFPEEVNRRIADLMATAYFAPTERARQALLREGFPAAGIHVTGNTVIDALRYVVNQPYDWLAGPLRSVPQNRQVVLVTAHRRESFGEPLQEICQAVRELADAFPHIQFVYPIHPNPNVLATVNAILAPAALPNLFLLPPLPYIDLVNLMRSSHIILTDSGGIQEEAPGLRVPVLVMRETTERPEGVEAGVVRLVGTRRATIVKEAYRLLTDDAARNAMTTGVCPYGDGRAAKRIVDHLVKWSR